MTSGGILGKCLATELNLSLQSTSKKLISFKISPSYGADKQLRMDIISTLQISLSVAVVCVPVCTLLAS